MLKVITYKPFYDETFNCSLLQIMFPSSAPLISPTPSPPCLPLPHCWPTPVSGSIISCCLVEWSFWPGCSLSREGMGRDGHIKQIYVCLTTDKGSGLIHWYPVCPCQIKHWFGKTHLLLIVTARWAIIKEDKVVFCVLLYYLEVHCFAVHTVDLWETYGLWIYVVMVLRVITDYMPKSKEDSSMDIWWYFDGI